MILRRHAATAGLTLALLASPAAAQQAVPAPAASADAYAVPPVPAPMTVGRDEYARRRAALVAKMGDGVLLVFGADEPEASYLRFAQTPPMQYLAGVTEPGARLVISRRGGEVRELLFVLPRDPAAEVWQGARLGTEGATQLTGIPARATTAMNAAVDSLLAAGGTLYVLQQFPGGGDEEARMRHAEVQYAAGLVQRHRGVKAELLDAQLSALRASKSPAELDRIRRAAIITALAQRQAMMSIRPAMNEFEIQAVIEGTFRRNGADGSSFGTIVGSGPNSTTLHYRSADRYMQGGEVVVMDIGASYRGYAADLTRTVPVGGRFTADQRAIYDIVLAAQKAAEAKARPGGNLGEMQQAAVQVIGQGLARLGLIESPDAVYDCDEGTCPQGQLFFMHGVGHGIGLEVHDPDVSYPPYGGRFTRGSAFTIEPGIYVRGDVLQYLKDTPRNRALRAKVGAAVRRYANIGVRIEDDYFITGTGFERVTAGAPREVDEIEALMARDGAWNRERRPEIVDWYRAGTPTAAPR